MDLRLTGNMSPYIRVKLTELSKCMHWMISKGTQEIIRRLEPKGIKQNLNRGA